MLPRHPLNPLSVPADGVVKLSDFGLGVLPHPSGMDGLLRTTCGTPNYVAPEVGHDWHAPWHACCCCCSAGCMLAGSRQQAPKRFKQRCTHSLPAVALLPRCWRRRGTKAAPPIFGRWVSEGGREVGSCARCPLPSNTVAPGVPLLQLLPPRRWPPQRAVPRRGAARAVSCRCATYGPHPASVPPPPPCVPGVVLYVILSGCLPFDEDDLVTLFHKISAAQARVWGRQAEGRGATGLGLGAAEAGMCWRHRPRARPAIHSRNAGIPRSVSLLSASLPSNTSSLPWPAHAV